MSLTIRPAVATDHGLIRMATIGNLNWVADRFTPDDVDATPAFAHYYERWPGPHDFGQVALDDGRPVGVVWMTYLTATDPGYGYVADDVPELSIWVDEGHRARGVGAQLMFAAIDEARSLGLRAMSLSVEAGNPARRLYERCGFMPVTGAAQGTMVLSM